MAACNDDARPFAQVSLAEEDAVAHIVIIAHAHDDFSSRRYLLRDLIAHWTVARHRVSLATELGDWPAADIAILHVDLSVVPTAYVEACKRYAVVVNRAATDIRKRLVSRWLVRPNDGWTGPVMIKTDLNSGGVPEQRFTRIARRRGQQADVQFGPFVFTENPYPILQSANEVPDAVWSNPGLVVERFLPERDERGFWMRAWVFFGDRERCTRYLGSEPVVKSKNILAREPASVPDELRAERRRLGFDYGKFDFVVHDGQAILFDANRTPTAAPPPVTPELEASNANLACGLDAILRT
jgi:hypothetical protein